MRLKSKTAVVLVLLAACMLFISSGCTTKVSKMESPTKHGEAGMIAERPEVVESGDEALKLLEEGNRRFVSGEIATKEFGKEELEKLAGGQKPFAIVLSCSDSRVPPETIFDWDLGDIFVVRVAGNVDDVISLGSIEYAAEHLKVPLLVVLGHSKCGAVKATVEGGEVPPNIAAIAKKISPAVEVAKAEHSGEEEIVEGAVVENVKNVLASIEKNSPVLKELIEKKELKVVGAKYELESGKVEFLEAAE